jgi:hypothetical protein
LPSWDELYTKELSNFEEIGDEGEVWFGEEVLDASTSHFSTNSTK